MRELKDIADSLNEISRGGLGPINVKTYALSEEAEHALMSIADSLEELLQLLKQYLPVGAVKEDPPNAKKNL